MDVDARFIKSQILVACQHLRRKGLVQLEEVDVLQRHVRLCKHLSHGADGREEDIFGRDATGGVSDDARHWLGIERRRGL
jgi:hypothetical protein